MDYISVQEAAEQWGVTRRHIQYLCAAGKIEGARKFTGVWMIPADAEKPLDGRRKKSATPTEGGRGSNE